MEAKYARIRKEIKAREEDLNRRLDRHNTYAISLNKTILWLATSVFTLVFISF
jgi:hypothetical protein